MLKTATSFFLLILLGSIGSALLGGAFAALIGYLSPDFVSNLFGGYNEELKDPISYAGSVGMIWGLFIGAAVAGFSCGLSVVLKLVKLRIDLSSQKTPAQD